jgi:hypothetical protein
VSLTRHQTELVKDIQGGIAFLKQEFPAQTKFSLGEVMERAGYDRTGIKLYAMIKILRKNKQDVELEVLRNLFASVGVKVLPLEKWSNETSIVVEEKSEDDLILIRQTDSEVVEPIAKRFDFSEVEMEATSFESKPYLASNRNIDRDIESLSEILKILAPLSRDKRESILSSAESFFAMGT